MKGFKIAFIQEELFPYMGFMYLSAIAKKFQHNVEVFVASAGEDFIQSVVEYKPDVICFSATSPSYNFTRETAKKLKYHIPESFVLVGGWHPTFNPEILQQETCFDALCLGEGEIPFEVFLQSYPDIEKMKVIPNFHIKINNRIYKNPLCDLIQNLDDIIFPDRSIYYDKFELLRNQLTRIFFAGRGCPFPCTYCFNENMKISYKNKGRYVRFRSPENIIKEIDIVKSKYPTKYIQFNDDTFNSDNKWLLSFLECYKLKCNLPFLIACRIERLDENIVKKMKEAGVDRIGFALEHGNEEYRKNVLRRTMSNSAIINGSQLLKKYNIRFHLNGMVGLPEETLDLAFETLRVCQQIKPDFAHMNLFQPYPGTQLYKTVKEKGLIRTGIKEDELTGHSSFGTNKTKLNSIMKNKDIKQMINLRSFFPLLVKYPRLLPFIKPLLLLPPNKYFEFVYAWSYTQIKFKYAANSREKINYFFQLTRKILPKFIQDYIEKRLGFQALM